VDFNRHPDVRSQLHAAKDEILEKVRKALEDAGLDDFQVESVGLYYKRPPKKCGPNEELCWEPIATGDDDTVTYGWVCKPKTP
jgi:hypothetical protein